MKLINSVSHTLSQLRLSFLLVFLFKLVVTLGVVAVGRSYVRVKREVKQYKFDIFNK